MPVMWPPRYPVRLWQPRDGLRGAPEGLQMPGRRFSIRHTTFPRKMSSCRLARHLGPCCVSGGACETRSHAWRSGGGDASRATGECVRGRTHATGLDPHPTVSEQSSSIIYLCCGDLRQVIILLRCVYIYVKCKLSGVGGRWPPAASSPGLQDVQRRPG